MSGMGPASVHRAALAALRDTTRAWDLAAPPADLPAALDARSAEAARAEGAGAAEVAAMARTYLFAARVGAQAAEPERAARWLTGWTAAARTTPAEVRAALTDGVRFAERLHRALGIAS